MLENKFEALKSSPFLWLFSIKNLINKYLKLCSFLTTLVMKEIMLVGLSDLGEVSKRSTALLTNESLLVA